MNEETLNVEYPNDATTINLDLIHAFILNLNLPNETVALILTQLLKLDNQYKEKYLFVIHISDEKATINFYIKVPLLNQEEPYPISAMCSFAKNEIDVLNEEFNNKFLFLSRRFIKPLYSDLKFQLKNIDYYIDGNKLNEIEIITPDEFSKLKNKPDEFS